MKIDRHYYNPTPEQRHELKVHAEKIRQRLAARRRRLDRPLQACSIRMDVERFLERLMQTDAAMQKVLEHVDIGASANRFTGEPPSGFGVRS